jgi:hypothetical protein|tara:strand:- start:129 stop:281 length:153 start_codon:yes stop_codon:yes gene_type:complete
MIDNISWTIWLILVIVWNYGFPIASPLADVLVALILSLMMIFLKKIWKKN